MLPEFHKKMLSNNDLTISPSHNSNYCYSLITMVIEVRIIGAYGVPQPFYFFITTRYWLGDNYVMRSASDIGSTTPIEASGKDLCSLKDK